MLKELNNRTKHIYNGTNNYCIEEQDFYELVKRDLDEFMLLKTFDKQEGTYIKVNDAQELLSVLHQKICKMTNFIKK